MHSVPLRAYSKIRTEKTAESKNRERIFFTSDHIFDIHGWNADIFFLTHLYTGRVFTPYVTASSQRPRWIKASKAMSVTLSLYRFSSGTSPTLDNRWQHLSDSVSQSGRWLKEKKHRYCIPPKMLLKVQSPQGNLKDLWKQLCIN